MELEEELDINATTRDGTREDEVSDDGVEVEACWTSSTDTEEKDGSGGSNLH